MSLADVSRWRAMWWAVGLALAAAVGYVLYSFVGTFVFGIFIYYATRPVYDRIRRRIPQPSVAAAVAIFALALPALLLVGYALLIVAAQVTALTDEGIFDPTRIPGVTPELIALLSNPEALLAIDWSRYLTPDVIDRIAESLSGALDAAAFFGTALLHLFIMLALAFYLLRDGGRLSRYFVTQFGDDGGVLEAYADAVDRDYRSIFFGNILNAIVTGTIAVISYSLLNTVAPPDGAIPAAALIGLIAGAASLVPIVGMKLVYVPVAAFMTAVAVATGGSRTLWFVALFVVVSFLVVDTIPDLVLRPYVSGRSLHVGAVMLAYTLGPLLFGWYGIFLMPMLLVLVVHFVRIVLPELVEGTTIRPYAVDPSALVDASPVAADPEPDADPEEE